MCVEMYDGMCAAETKLGCNKLLFQYYSIIYEFIYSLFASGNMNEASKHSADGVSNFFMVRAYAIGWETQKKITKT